MAANGGEKLTKCILDALLGDSDLVALLDHDASQPKGLRIGMNRPNVAGRLPYLGFDYASYAMAPNCTRLQRALVDFTVAAKAPITAIRVADRLEYLLHGDYLDPTQMSNRYFWNISSTGVSVKDFKFVSRARTVFDNDVDTYAITIVTTLIWTDVDCRNVYNEPSCV